MFNRSYVLFTTDSVCLVQYPFKSAWLACGCGQGQSFLGAGDLTPFDNAP
ncbi:hypothetical protein [Caudoviricetes sp.]|nr:hypothetical protein [Caudoviricetes sp.]